MRALKKYGRNNFTRQTLIETDNQDLLNEYEELFIELYYSYNKDIGYNILPGRGEYKSYSTATVEEQLAKRSGKNHPLYGIGHSEETKAKISKALKGVYVKEKSALYGSRASEETKALMSLKKSKSNNPLFGKTHTEETKELMRQKALGRKHSEETLLKMSASRGYPVQIYEKCNSEGFQLIGSFVSTRKAANFLGISASTVRLYINSGEIFKYRYKFTGGNPK